MFLRFERANAHMHVGATLVFEAGGLARGARGVDVARIRRHIGAQLSAVPRYRQRLHAGPIDGRPVWIDDPAFDLRVHVRHLRLSAAADARALHQASGRILSQPLDRRRPLWEMWIVDGFANGRFAIVNKMHHCMVDGIAGADLLALLLAVSPDAPPPPPLAWVARPAPSAGVLLRDRAEHLWRSAGGVAAEIVDVVRQPSRVREWTQAAAALWSAVGAGIRPAPASPLNRPIGPHRRFEWLSLDLDAVMEIKRQLGGTVNDVVLTTVAGALRRLLVQRDPDHTPHDLRALVPVSTRGAADASALGNHVAAWLLPLPVAEVDPLRRLARVQATTAALKGNQDTRGAELLSSAGCALLSTGVRLLERLRPYNVVVTNVPGPPLPLYLLGARLRHVYPLVPLFPNQGLGVAVFSYAGTLCWGVNADCHIVPDAAAFIDALTASFEELRAAAGSAVVANHA